ncbi:MAG: ThuA domain-containing protein [Akkermansiaceae bacterium]|nr:ThuA domain-containing protein [Akkermansiaceae bacterium]
MKKILLIPLALLAVAFAFSQTQKLPRPDARRVEVLFVGAPTANHPGHDPVERYRILRKSLGTAGIDFAYTEDLADLRRDVLDRYDAVMMYANWKQNEEMDPAQEKALISYVEDGGAFLPIHCASACFGKSDAFIKLVGGRFKSHGDGVFRTTITAPDHPVMKGFEGFETWDETYVHDRHGDDRTILQRREEEPWTWVRKQGKGNVFYTAYGHDMRCWGQSSFHELLRRAILWSVGAEVRAKLTALKLPELETEEVLLPGYKLRKAITKAQKPLAPAESIKLANVPAGFELSLFASEPDIVNPIHIAWDHRGRAFVVETVDYPNNLQAGNLGHDRIRVCEDTDGDGKADKFTLFADKLSIPTSAVFANGGLICTNGTQMLFLKDTNGDDVADERKVLFDGFSMGDTHAGPSNLLYAPDNWIYATVGYSGFDGTVGGEKHKFSQGVFRFRPDGSKLEFLQSTTNNTWGLGFTSDFDLMGSTANANPSWYFTFPKSLYESAGMQAPRTPRADDNPKFFPSSMDIRQVDVHDGYTSAAGHGFYTSTRFPEEWREKVAMVTEPTGKLVGLFEVSRTGAGYKSRHLPNTLFDSADAWSSPVFAETGPDGSIWICDWYNIIIQHNPTPKMDSAGMDAVTGRGNAYETPLRDTSYGRIYRVYPKNTADDRKPDLDIADPGTLIAGLSHENLFWRLQSQRLLVETKAIGATAKLKELVKGNNAAAMHAFGALSGLGALDTDTVATGLKSEHRGLRRQAISHPLAEPLLVANFSKDEAIFAADARELAEVLAALARLAPSDDVGALLYQTMVKNRESLLKDATLSDAWQIAARRHAKGVLLGGSETTVATAPPPPNLLPNAKFEEAGPAGWSLRNYVVEDRSKVSMQVTPGGRSGNCLMIRADARADVGAGAEVKVKPNTRYRFGAWVRTEKLEKKGGEGAMLNIHGTDAKTKSIAGDTGWTELSAEFESGGETSVLIHCLFGGYGGATGTAWWDDVYLQEVSPGDGSSVLLPIASHFGANASPADVQSLANVLSSRKDDFSKEILARIQTRPVAAKPVERKHKPDPAIHARGLAIYNKTCIACHGPEGKGVPGAFPPLDGAPMPVGDPSIPIRIIMHGLQGPIEVLGQKYNVPMAALGELKDAEIADVLTYVRQSWTNDASAVDEKTVKQVRAKYASRKTPWTIEELK